MHVFFFANILSLSHHLLIMSLLSFFHPQSDQNTLDICVYMHIRLFPFHPYSHRLNTQTHLSDFRKCFHILEKFSSKLISNLPISPSIAHHFWYAFGTIFPTHLMLIEIDYSDFWHSTYLHTLDLGAMSFFHIFFGCHSLLGRFLRKCLKRKYD